MATRDLVYFQSIPWCSYLLNDPEYVITPTSSREPKENTEDALFGETLKTDQTISACLSLYKRPKALGELIEEVKTLFTVGSGVNGYPHVCHGGIVATMIDEVMGILLAVNKNREEAARDSRRPAERMATVTAELTVKYLKPLKTPQTVCVTARFARVEGRKLWIKGTIIDESGTALACAQSIFVQKQREKL
ncbi:hypothetical protein CC78DRAFT_531645 [Lojkania enalia]|uniref:Thioesterase domain-containing protein n=1 Tax=Lojkania enalia TaxID=147567 RepID=A0A9P4KHX7_9PLEO|nr:hypothetical protein CC78DRAFT_531645 [Didymosphaeria enalia]